MFEEVDVVAWDFGLGAVIFSNYGERDADVAIVDGHEFQHGGGVFVDVFLGIWEAMLVHPLCYDVAGGAGFCGIDGDQHINFQT